MRKIFKLRGTGLDLRYPTKTMITPIPEDNISGLGSIRNIEYILLDLLEGKDWLTKDLAEEVIVKGAAVIVCINLNKLPKENRLSATKVLLRQWSTSCFSLPTFPKLLLLSGISKEDKNDDIEDFKYITKSDCKLGLLIENPVEGKADLEAWKEVFGEYPKQVARPISPLLYNLDFENTLKVQNIVTWGLDWNGGDLTKEVEYAAFSRSYLLSFAAFHSDVVLLPTHRGCGVEEMDDLNFLKNLKYKEMREKEDAKYILKKSVSRLVKAPKKVVYESIKIPCGWQIPIDSTKMSLPDYDSITFSFGSEVKNLEHITETEDLSDIEYSVLERIKFQNNPNLSESEELSWRNMQIITTEVLEEYFHPEDRWEFSFFEIGEHALGINLLQYKKRNWLTKRLPKELENLRVFVLVMKDPESFFFLDLENHKDNFTPISEMSEKSDQ